MIQHLILAFLIVGGIIGWGLFSYTLVQLICNRHTEIEMINEIKKELKILKEEINSLK